ncbi:MAG: PrsW family intramembrane metalloprotease [Candidatus Pacebacteria bacterium]|nr:PrsW family intramembrane metalloprotease [Candidatus Paceibacterota bacterium]
MFSNPKILGLAFVGGILPSLFWLWFWLKEERKKTEPRSLLTMCFVVGMMSVFFVLPVQKFIQGMVGNSDWQIVLWATAEELIKYIAVWIILFKTTYVDEPLDWPILMITTALGFAAMENILFLVRPFLFLDQITLGLLRYLGSTLLHSVSSGVIGISMGLSFYIHGARAKFQLLIGIFVSIALHSVFNFFIMENDGGNFLKALAFLWVVTIIIMLLFEKLRRMQ